MTSVVMRNVVMTNVVMTNTVAPRLSKKKNSGKDLFRDFLATGPKSRRRVGAEKLNRFGSPNFFSRTPVARVSDAKSWFGFGAGVGAAATYKEIKNKIAFSCEQTYFGSFQ